MEYAIVKHLYNVLQQHNLKVLKHFTKLLRVGVYAIHSIHCLKTLVEPKYNTTFHTHQCHEIVLQTKFKLSKLNSLTLEMTAIFEYVKAIDTSLLHRLANIIIIVGKNNRKNMNIICQ